jgi:hypothetical protein
VTAAIRTVTVRPARVSDAEAVLDVCVELVGPGWELRGTLVGPKRTHASTVEVAYPLRLIELSDTAATLRVVLPEPTLGTPADPARYDGIVEAWRSGACAESRAFAVVFRGK